MSEANEKELIKDLQKYIDEISKDYSIPDIMLRRSLNEAWFSDTLAWLLDPKTEDYLGVAFIDEFIKCVAKKRSDNKIYKRKNSFLKFGDKGPGRAVTGTNKFSLKNAAVMREFYLSSYSHKNSKATAQFCDIVLFDLDPKDGIILIVENKLFGTNHPDQLENYYHLIESKYDHVDTREYVYLTLTGEEPISYGPDKSDDKILKENWIRLSWTKDVLEVLEKAINRNDNNVPEDVNRLKNLLHWLNSMVYPGKTMTNKIEKFNETLINVAAKSLTAHLNRLSVEGRSWSQKNNIKSSIMHSSVPKRVLYVQMLPNLSITVQGKNKSKSYYEKILIPFGTYPDQVYHLLYIAARDVYSKHFGNKEKYMNKKRKLTATELSFEKRIRPMLDFIYNYKFHLQVMLSVSKMVRNANMVEEVRDVYGDDEALETLEKLEPEKKQE